MQEVIIFSCIIHVAFGLNGKKYVFCKIPTGCKISKYDSYGKSPVKAPCSSIVAK